MHLHLFEGPCKRQIVTDPKLRNTSQIVNDDGKIATIVNRYFTNITKHMKLKANKISHQEEPLNILDTIKNHMSVQRIKLANFHFYSTLSFLKVTESEVAK